MAAANIVGFAPPSMHGDYYGELAEHHRMLFDGVGSPPTPGMVIVAHDGTRILGGAIVDAENTSYLPASERDTALRLASHHRVLAGMFVVQAARGRGIGRELIDEASVWALRDGARYLDGFVDDRNAGSVKFYQRAGAQVLPHNRGLPARHPSRVEQSHRHELDGHWFYVDAWERHSDLVRCRACGGGVMFDPSDGGRLLCPECETMPEGQQR